MSYATKFYPLENDRNRFEVCRTIKQFGQSIDTRYKSTQGVSISEYDVQDESKVYKTLKALPGFKDFVSSNDKKNTLYKFWQRPALDYALKCEKDHPRSSVIAAAKVQKNQKSLNGGAVDGLVITAFVGGIIVSSIALCLTVKGDNVMAMAIPSSICLSCQAILFGIAWILVCGQANTLNERKDSIKALMFINSCGDDFTNLPESFLTEIDAAAATSETSETYALLLMIFPIIAMIACIAECMTGGSKKTHKDHGSGSDSDHYERASDE